MAHGEQFPLLKNCKLTINSKVVVDTRKLFKLLTNELKFKIVGCDPLIIEKDDPSQVDIGKVFDGLRSLCKARESRDETVNPNVQCNVHDVTNSTSLSQTGHTIGDHYQLVSRSNNVNSEDVTQDRSCKESESSDTAVCENVSQLYKENIISEMNIPLHDTDKIKQMHRVHGKDKEGVNKLIEVTEEQSKRESKLLNEMLLNFATTDLIIKDTDKLIVNESAAEYLTQMSNYEQLDEAKRANLPNEDVELKHEVLMRDICSSRHRSASKDIDKIKSFPEWHNLDKDDTKDMNSLSMDNKISAVLQTAYTSTGDHLLVRDRGDNENVIIKGNGHNKIASRPHQTVSLMCNTSSLCSNLDVNKTTDKSNVEKTNVEEQSQNIQQVEKRAASCSVKRMKSIDQQMQQEESENAYFPEMSCETNISEEMLSTETSKTKEEDTQNDNTCNAENENYAQFQGAPEMHITSLDHKILGNVCMLQAGCENEIHKQTLIQILKQKTKYTKENNFELEVKSTEECQSVRSEHNEDMNSSSLLVSGTYSDNKSGYCLVSDECKLNIRIYKANITELQVDCIVNAANKYLMHKGGVARAISDAAGPTLRKECNNYRKDGRVLDVTGVFVSTGGKLAAKFVIHAVGPEWDLYDQKNKHQCLTDLRHTVIRCLVEANKRGATSVALPSISAAIFRVPKELCARCYMEAVKHFDVLTRVEDKVNLKEIHFVDVDATMVDIIAECFTNNWSKQSDIDIVLKDAEFVDKHLKSASENKIKNHHRLSIEETKCANGTSTLYSVLTEDVVGAAAPFTNQPLVHHFSSNQDCSSWLRKNQSDVSQSAAALKRNQSNVSQSESALKRDQSDVSQSKSDLKRDQLDVTQSESALRKDQSDVSQSESAPKSDQSDVSQSGSALKTDQSDVSQLESALKRDQLDVSQSESAMKRGQSDVSQSESALKRDQSDVSQSESALKRDQLDFCQSESALKRDHSDVIQSELALKSDQSDVSQLESALKRDQSDVSQSESALKRDQLDFCQSESALKRDHSDVSQSELALKSDQSDVSQSEFALKRDQTDVSQSESALIRDVSQSAAALKRDQSDVSPLAAALKRDQSDVSQSESSLERYQSDVDLSELALKRDQLYISLSKSALKRDQSDIDQLELALKIDQSDVSQSESALKRDQSNISQSESALKSDLSHVSQSESALKRDQSESALKRDQLDVRQSESALKRDVSQSAAALKRDQADVSHSESAMKSDQSNISQSESALKCNLSDVSQPESALKIDHSHVSQSESALKRDQSNVSQSESALKRDQSDVSQSASALKRDQSDVSQSESALKSDLSHVSQSESALKRDQSESALKRDLSHVSQSESALKRDQSESALKRDQLDVRQSESALKRDVSQSAAALKRDQADVSQSESALKSDQSNISQSESALKCNLSDVSQPESALKRDQSDVSQSELALKSDQSDVSQSESALKSDLSHVNQSESALKSDQSDVTQLESALKRDVSQSESALKRDQSDVSQFTAALKRDQSHVSQSELALERYQSDIDQLELALKRDQSDVSQSESALKRDQSDVSESEPALKTDQSAVSQSPATLKIDHSDVSQSESALKSDLSHVSQSESALKRDQSDISQSESALKRDQSYISQSFAALKRGQSDVNQLAATLKRDQSDISQMTGELNDETCMISGTFQIGKITLHVDSRHAFDLKADVTFTMGKPFDKLGGASDFSISTSLKLCENVCCKENKYTYFNVSQLDGSQSRFLCEVFPEPDKMETTVEAFGNLREVIQSCKKLPKILIITSNVLYAESALKRDQSDVSQFTTALKRDQSHVSQSESALERYQSDIDQLELALKRDQSDVSQSESALKSDQSNISQSESALKRDHSDVSQSELALQSDQSDVSQSESALKSDLSHVSQSESALKRDQSDVSQSESALKRDQSDVSESEPALKTDQSAVSQSPATLKIDHSDVSQSESALKSDLSHVSQSESALKRDQSDISQSESALKRDQSYISQSFAALKRGQSDVNQLAATLKRDQSDINQTTGELSDETCMISGTFQIGKITLHVDSRHAFDLKADVTFTMGKPFDKLGGASDFSISTSLKLCENVCCKENKYTYFNVSQLDGSQSRFLCEVFPEPDKMETTVEAFGNLREVIQSCKKLPKILIITSNVLYADPSNVQLPTRKKRHLHVKTVGMFAISLYNYLDKLSKDTQEDISIFVVGSEDSLPIIVEVIESYNVVKTVPSYVAATVQTSSACDFCGQNKSVERVACCGKWLCEDCEQIASTCPFCLKLRKIITGNQPPGLMKVALINDYADGYENINVWKIKYYFPDGTQKQCHPRPGKTYASVKRTAYLPDNDQGYQVLLRLRLAFIRNLIFTIGHSDSRNKDDVIVWDGISHKTSLHDGKKHGYPDADYLSQVTLELANKGVLLANATTLEKEQLSDFTYHIKKFNKFSDTELDLSE